MSTATIDSVLPGIKGYYDRMGFQPKSSRELVKMIQFLVDRQRDVRTQFDKMQMQAETERNTLIQDNTKYQLLLDRTIDQIAAVMPIIVGGQLALQRGLEEFNALRTQAEEQPGNTLLASQVQDFSNNLEAKKSEGDYITKIALLVSMKDTLVQICEDGKKIVEDNRQKRVEAIENLKTVKSEWRPPCGNRLPEQRSFPLHRSKLFRGMGLILTLAPKSGQTTGCRRKP